MPRNEGLRPFSTLPLVAFLFGSLPLSPTHAVAQGGEIVIPGSPLVDATIIEPGRELFQLLILQPGGTERPVSRLRRSIEATDIGGTPTWTIVQVYESERGPSVDSSIVRRRDLAPLRYAYWSEGETHRFVFEGRRVVGTVQPADSAARTVRYELAETPFNAVMDVDVIRALPLEPGFEARIAGYNPPRPPSPGPTRIEVLRTEPLATADGEVDAWVLSYEAGGAPTTIWIATDDRRFLRLRSELNGGAVFWKLPVSDLARWRAHVRDSAGPGSGRGPGNG